MAVALSIVIDGLIASRLFTESSGAAHLQLTPDRGGEYNLFLLIL
jgi:hypothetical protein